MDGSLTSAARRRTLLDRICKLGVAGSSWASRVGDSPRGVARTTLARTNPGPAQVQHHLLFHALATRLAGPIPCVLARRWEVIRSRPEGRRSSPLQEREHVGTEPVPVGKQLNGLSAFEVVPVPVAPCDASASRPPFAGQRSVKRAPDWRSASAASRTARPSRGWSRSRRPPCRTRFVAGRDGRPPSRPWAPGRPRCRGCLDRR